MGESLGLAPPRVLWLDPSEFSPGRTHRRAPVAFADPHPGLDALGRLGGAGLALALLARAERDRARGWPAFAAGLGAAVVARLPTAARLALAARSPLHGGLAEGQVGGTLAARLAPVLDGLCLRGAPKEGHGVLLLRPELAGGAVGVEFWDGARAAGLGISERIALLYDSFGPGAALVAGPLALGPPWGPGAAFSHVASAELLPAGALHPPSRTGRGGLGRELARLGLWAIAVLGEGVPKRPVQPAEGAASVLSALGRSPRLRARSVGGSLELFDAAAARGEPGPLLSAESFPPVLAREGCTGCPTPCGLVIRHPNGQRGSIRYAAARPLSGLFADPAPSEVAELLRLADEWGLDALELGRRLGAADPAQAAPSETGPAGRLVELKLRLGRLAAGELPDPGPGPPPWPAVPPGRGEAAVAARLAPFVVAGGSDPLRLFPALVEGAEPGSLCAQVPFAPSDVRWCRPEHPAGKGQLLAWFESLAAAADASGFCAFSASALLADGLLDLEALARASAPAFGSSAQRYAEAGARIAFARALMALSPGARGEAPLASTLPTPLGALPAELRGPARAYRRQRGLSPDGRPLPRARAAFDRGELWPEHPEFRPTARGHANGAGAAGVTGRRSELGAAQGPPLDGASGAPRVFVTLFATGPLGAALGAPLVLSVPSGATLGDALRVAAEVAPRAVLLDARGEPSPSAWRHGVRLLAADRLEADDQVHLVQVLPGG